MKFIRGLLMLFVFVAFLPLPSAAQEQVPVEEDLTSTYIDIGEHMLTFQEELNQLSVLSRFQVNIDLEMPLTDALLDVVAKRIQSLNASLASFKVRWATYSQAQQVYVAENDTLLEKVAQIQQLEQMVADTLTFRQQQYDQLAALPRPRPSSGSRTRPTASFIGRPPSIRCHPSLPHSEKVKAEEANIFADAQNYYGQAKAASESFPGLKVRMKGMEQKYNELQSVSAKIQEMAYKPLIQRVKDYLLGLAAVAILMMFFNLLTARLKSLKQARDQAKKLKEQMQGQRNYPTI